MSVTIGHASTNNYAAPDQVKFSPFYNGGWHTVLRPRSESLAAKSAAICEACVNKNTSGATVLYSQGDKRNTLKRDALVKAGFASNDNSKLSQITPNTIAALSRNCWADCSSFMTFCALCGGATFSYDYYGGDNAPTCSVMRKHFTKNGASNREYDALTDAVYLTSPRYLRRGDILISNGHTVMVLDNGSNANITPNYAQNYSGTSTMITEIVNTAFVDITSLKITSSISNLDSSSVTISLKVTKLEDDVEKGSVTSTDLAAYNWQYDLKLLNTENSIRSGKLAISSATTTHVFKDLSPNETYVFNVTATKIQGNTKLNSANLIFTTAYARPTAVRNLTIAFNNTDTLNKKCYINFDAPNSWGNSALRRCYRVTLHVNGTIVAYNDSLLTDTSAVSYRNKMIALNQITSNTSLFGYNDTIQIGILPGLKDSGNNFIFDRNALKCSEPLIVQTPMKLLNKLYIKIQNTFKRSTIYNKS